MRLMKEGGLAWTGDKRSKTSYPSFQRYAPTRTNFTLRMPKNVLTDFTATKWQQTAAPSGGAGRWACTAAAPT